MICLSLQYWHTRYPQYNRRLIVDIIFVINLRVEVRVENQHSFLLPTAVQDLFIRLHHKTGKSSTLYFPKEVDSSYVG